MTQLHLHILVLCKAKGGALRFGPFSTRSITRIARLWTSKRAMLCLSRSTPHIHVSSASECTSTHYDGMHCAETPVSVVNMKTNSLLHNYAFAYYCCARPRGELCRFKPSNIRRVTRVANFLNFKYARFDQTRVYLFGQSFATWPSS